MEPCQVFENKQVTYDDWTPKNADGKYGGEYTMGQALAHSINTIAAQIIDIVGVKKTVNLAERVGINSEMPRVKSLARGTAEVSLMEMVTAYSSLANKGIRTNPGYITKISNDKGVLLREYEPQENKEAIDPDNAATIIEMMRAVVKKEAHTD